MATIRPFRAFRPNPTHAREVASRPYDVLTSVEARTEAAGNRFSFLHVGKPEIDLPEETNLYDERVYRKGNENLQQFMAEGILQQDDKPCLYLYSQTMGDHTQHGIACCVSAKEYVNGTIKKHELTRPDKEDDRTRHIEATNAHTGPIFLAYRAQQSLDAMTQEIRGGMPEYDFVASDSVRHQVWVINEEYIIGSIVQAFSGIDSMYIADGHHRAAAAVRAARNMAQANPSHTGHEEYNFFLAVLFPHAQVKIMAYNRLVKDLNKLSTEIFLQMTGRRFEVVRAKQPVVPSRKGEIGMYLRQQWYLLKPMGGIVNEADPLERLDVSILQNHVLGPLLGIDDPRTSSRIEFVGGIKGVAELEKRVDSREMAVAFSLFPTSIDELFAIADAGKIMPPKSTWFEPKLRDGILVHMLG